jgi:hypothetical protein
MRLVFSGVVLRGDDHRADRCDLNGSVWVGGRDVVAEVEGVCWSGPVTVAVADERFTGDLAVEMGWGYSEFTPIDRDRLSVGPHNLISVIERLEGQDITVWIADEPINVLESAP